MIGILRILKCTLCDYIFKHPENRALHVERNLHYKCPRCFGSCVLIRGQS